MKASIQFIFYGRKKLADFLPSLKDSHFVFVQKINNTDPFKEKGMRVCMKIDIKCVNLKADISINYVTSPSALTGNNNISQQLDINETYASVDVFLKFQLIATHHPLTTFTDMRGESCRAVASATSLWTSYTWPLNWAFSNRTICVETWRAVPRREENQGQYAFRACSLTFSHDSLSA